MTELEFNNLRELILSCERAVSTLSAHEDGALLYECVETIVPFLVGMGQAVSASTYAAFGKISKELAYTTMNRWAQLYSGDIQHILDTVKIL